MSSFSGVGCTARWSGQELELSNGLFARKWIWRDGFLAPSLLTVDGYSWAGRSEEAGVRAPVGLGQKGFDGEPVLAAKVESSAVGEPYLAVTLTAGSTVYEFRLWEQLAGYAARLTFAGAGQVPIEDEATKFGTGVELSQPKAEAKTEIDVLEAFQFSGQSHIRLSAPQFFDQSDFHAELVHDREYLLHPCEWDVLLKGNVFAAEDLIAGQGLVMVKHAALPHSRAVKVETDGHLSRGTNFTLHGHGTLSGTGDWWGVFTYSGGENDRVAAMHQYQRLWRVYRPGRDGLMISNTWGDRGQDKHLSPQFMRAEVESAARLGVDIVQIDDGWQRGMTANSAFAKGKGGAWGGYWDFDDRFWDVNEARFPEGLDALVEAASEHGMNFGLWFAPDSKNDCAYWERDVEAVLRRQRELGIKYFKIDSLHLEGRLGEERLRKFVEQVQAETDGAVTFDMDITAEDRLGPFGTLEAGPLFVENRYTDWHRYWPHRTLRVGWQMAKWIDPVRLRLEWLNNQRHQDKYEGDPLAPVRWRPDAIFATVMPFSPLGWFEVQNLPEAYHLEAAPLIATWKQHREALHGGVMTPIGKAPDGVSWAGFFWKSAGAEYALVFRELNSSGTWQVEVPGVGCGSGEVLGGCGSAVLGGGVLEVNVPAKLDFVWVRWEV